MIKERIRKIREVKKNKDLAWVNGVFRLDFLFTKRKVLL